jgi:hypothetical protein
MAEVLVTADVTLLRTDISKQEAREDIQGVIVNAVDYTNQAIGRGFRISDLGSIIDAVGNGTLVDFVDITRLTRIPRPVYTGTGIIPQIQGQIQIGTAAPYASFKIVGKVGDITKFVIDQVDPVVSSVGEGTVGTEFTSPDQALKFTLGKPGETMTTVQTVTFSTSKYKGNLRIANAEIMALSNLNQLAINIFYPGESDPFV